VLDRAGQVSSNAKPGCCRPCRKRRPMRPPGSGGQLLNSFYNAKRRTTGWRQQENRRPSGEALPKTWLVPAPDQFRHRKKQSKQESETSTEVQGHDSSSLRTHRPSSARVCHLHRAFWVLSASARRSLERFSKVLNDFRGQPHCCTGLVLTSIIILVNKYSRGAMLFSSAYSSSV